MKHLHDIRGMNKLIFRAIHNPYFEVPYFLNPFPVANKSGDNHQVGSDTNKKQYVL
jgi:hypothetical protein